MLTSTRLRSSAVDSSVTGAVAAVGDGGTAGLRLTNARDGECLCGMNALLDDGRRCGMLDNTVLDDIVVPDKIVPVGSSHWAKDDVADDATGVVGVDRGSGSSDCLGKGRERSSESGTQIALSGMGMRGS